jgi:hypothetical protein
VTLDGEHGIIATTRWQEERLEVEACIKKKSLPRGDNGVY